MLIFLSIFEDILTHNQSLAADFPHTLDLVFYSQMQD